MKINFSRFSIKLKNFTAKRNEIEIEKKRRECQELLINSNTT